MSKYGMEGCCCVPCRVSRITKYHASLFRGIEKLQQLYAFLQPIIKFDKEYESQDIKWEIGNHCAFICGIASFEELVVGYSEETSILIDKLLGPHGKTIYKAILARK